MKFLCTTQLLNKMCPNVKKNNCLTKAYNRLLKLVRISIDIILIIIFIPIYAVLILFLATVGRNIKKQKFAIFCGLEHVIKKTITRGEYFKTLGFDVLYLSFEKTLLSKTTRPSKEVLKVKWLLAIDALCFALILRKKNPVYVELYFEGLGFHQLVYSMLSSLNDTTIISIHRGIAEKHLEKSNIRKYLRLLSYQLSNSIFYRDPKMINHFRKMRIDDGKLFYDYNRIPISSEPNFNKKEKKILFLNGIQPFRRIDLLIESMPIILTRLPDAHLTIVGCRNEKEFNYVNDLVSRFKVLDSVQVEYFTNKPRYFYDMASVFVLPADIVFCNFSLIECMERGVPAIVANVEDAENIIEHGVNGYLAKQTAADLAKYIIKLLLDEGLRLKMGKAARQTIIEKFNDQERMTPIYNLLLEKHKNVIQL